MFLGCVVGGCGSESCRWVAEKGDEGLLFGLLNDRSAHNEHDVSACGVPGWQSVCERYVGEEFEVNIMLCKGAAR